MDFLQTPSFHVSFWWLCDLRRGEAWNKGSKQKMKCQDAWAVTTPILKTPTLVSSRPLTTRVSSWNTLWRPVIPLSCSVWQQLICSLALYFYGEICKFPSDMSRTCLESKTEIILGLGMEIQFEKIRFSLCLFHTMPILAIYRAKFWHWQFFALY